MNKQKYWEKKITTIHYTQTMLGTHPTIDLCIQASLYHQHGDIKIRVWALRTAYKTWSNSNKVSCCDSISAGVAINPKASCGCTDFSNRSFTEFYMIRWPR